MVKKRKLYLAVDIGTAFIKIVGIIKQAHPQSHQIEFIKILPMPKSEWGDNLGSLSELVNQLISKAIQHFYIGKNIGKRACKPIGASIPAISVMTQIVSILNDLDDADIEVILGMKIAEYFPFDPSEVTIDFQKIKKNTPVRNDHEQQNVLLIAVEKKIVINLESSINTKYYDVSRVDVDMYALMNVIRFAKSLPLSLNDTPVNDLSANALLVIDVGASRVAFNVCHFNGVIYAREFLTGGDYLTQMISTSLGISRDEAAQKKCADIWHFDDMAVILCAYLAEFSNELSKIFSIYSDGYPTIQFQNVFLSGGGAAVPNIGEVISAIIKQPIHILNPLDVLAVSSDIDSLSLSEQYSLSIACGVALGGLYD